MKQTMCNILSKGAASEGDAHAAFNFSATLECPGKEEILFKEYWNNAPGYQIFIQNKDTPNVKSARNIHPKRIYSWYSVCECFICQQSNEIGSEMIRGNCHFLTCYQSVPYQQFKLTNYVGVISSNYQTIYYSPEWPDHRRCMSA